MLCTSYVVIMDLEMMRVATPHIGVEPCAWPKTDVMGLPRVVVKCLLALAQHTRKRNAIETSFSEGLRRGTVNSVLEVHEIMDVVHDVY